MNVASIWSYLPLREMVLKISQQMMEDDDDVVEHKIWIVSPVTEAVRFNKRLTTSKYNITRMWANAQPDGRPAEHRRRPLFNAAKYSCRPILQRRAVMLPRRETCWNLLGCRKLANRCPLVRQSSPYYEDMWRMFRCLTSFFFRLSIHAVVAKIWPDKVVRWCPDGDHLRPVFLASRVQHISHMH